MKTLRLAVLMVLALAFAPALSASNEVRIAGLITSVAPLYLGSTPQLAGCWITVDGLPMQWLDLDGCAHAMPICRSCAGGFFQTPAKVKAVLLDYRCELDSCVPGVLTLLVVTLDKK